MTYYVELRRTVSRTGPLRYVPLEELSQHTGFRSVYAVAPALRKVIEERGSVADLRDYSVYSDTLFVDFDTDEGVEEFRTTLQGLGVGYERYDTGRRGAHFHIPIAPLRGVHVPRSQAAWVAHHATGSWDNTLYRPASLFRLPGTWHEKHAGAMKVLTETVPGPKLNIPEVMSIKVELRAADSGGQANPASFWSALLKPKAEPGRTARIYYLGALAAECGISRNDGLAAVEEWGATLARPVMQDRTEVARAFNNGYRRGSK